MSVKVEDIMAKRVVSVRPHNTVSEVKDVLGSRRLHALPVLDDQNRPVGIVSATDLVRSDVKDGTKVSRIMSRDVVVIPRYAEIVKVARTMRRRKIHHLVVTHEKEVVGVISSFDIVKLVEQSRLLPKGNAAEKKKVRPIRRA